MINDGFSSSSRIMQTGGRVALTPRSSARLWWMIKLDKWFAALNCPLPAWCPLECDTSAVARSERDLVAASAARVPSVCYSERICPHQHSIITPLLIDVEHFFDPDTETLFCTSDSVDMDTTGPGRWPHTRPVLLASATKCLLTGECWSVVYLQSRYSGDQQNSDGGQGVKRAMAEVGESLDRDSFATVTRRRQVRMVTMCWTLTVGVQSTEWMSFKVLAQPKGATRALGVFKSFLNQVVISSSLCNIYVMMCTFYCFQSVFCVSC